MTERKAKCTLKVFRVTELTKTGEKNVVYFNKVENSLFRQYCQGGEGHENFSFSKGRHDRESLTTTALSDKPSRARVKAWLQH